MNDLIACLLIFAAVALVFGGLALIYVDVWRVLCMQLAYSDGEPVRRFKVPSFRWGGLDPFAHRDRHADVVELHNRERGEAA